MSKQKATKTNVSLSQLIEDEKAKAATAKADARKAYRVLLLQPALTEQERARLVDLLPLVGKHLTDLEKDQGVLQQAADLQKQLDQKPMATLKAACRVVRHDFDMESEEWRRGQSGDLRHNAMIGKLRQAEMQVEACDRLGCALAKLTSANPELFS